ncbi:L-lactate dehydrogenase B chain-like [Trichoplusia ni]|uniref:L-lactate dehydrogenase B chain-like n=1 Tax=Trichoplusia ni TaxID=7111 RepID=A0A7E5WYM8_TRINI|nr:L-lactate dehydrogenase B chain-like [Trichoplusia ni]
MILQNFTRLPHLSIGMKKNLFLNASCVYNGILLPYVKSINRAYSKAEDDPPDDEDVRKSRPCKQFTTIGKILNSVGAKSLAGNNKVSVIGLDDIGIATVFALLTQNVTDNVCMIDLNEEVLKGEHLDLQYSSVFLNNPCITASKDPAATRESKVCVVTTGTFKGRDEDESEYVARNAGIIRAIVPSLMRHSPNAIYIIASDPVDILSYTTWKLSGVPKHKVIGTGTMLDTARFRYLLSDKLGISPEHCHGFVIGQQGQRSVPVWSSVNIAGVRLKDINPQIGTERDPESWSEVHEEVMKSADKVRQLKGNSSWAVALAVSDLCRAIFTNKNTVIPVSTHVKGEHSIREDVFLSLPCVIGRSGVTDIVRQTLTEVEALQLRRCAENVAQMQEFASKLMT